MAEHGNSVEVGSPEYEAIIDRLLAEALTRPMEGDPATFFMTHEESMRRRLGDRGLAQRFDE